MRAPAPNNDGMGSLPGSAGCRFRVWSPNANAVQVILNDAATGPTFNLASEPGTGNWSADQIPAPPGTKYQYIVMNMGGPNNDNSQPWVRTDARALQVESSNAASMGYVVDPAVFVNSRTTFTTPPFQDFLIYQLHVGSFSGRNDQVAVNEFTATFIDVIDKLDYIRGLGFNAIELLPITDFRCDVGGAGEGYGPSDMFASEDLYATSPEKAVSELIRLIDAAHARGLAVILDVVYNHAGINDNRYWRYDGNFAGDDEIYNGAPISIRGGIYFVHGYHTPWGEGFALWQQEIKDFLLDNARMCLRDYRVDGLRFDAVQAMQSDGVEYIVQTLRAEFPDKYLIAEYNSGDSSTSASPPQDPYGTLGFCATWDLASPGQTFSLLGENNVVQQLQYRIGQFSDPNPWRLVAYLTGSHDQVYGGQGDSGMYFAQRFGGRENGWARSKARLAWALNATLAATPMLFMGTEGHLDGFWDPVVSAGYDHRIDWLQIGDALGAPMQQMVRDINQLRWAHPALRSPAGFVTHADDQNQVVAFKRYNLAGDVLLVVVNAGNGQWDENQYAVNLAGDGGTWLEVFNSQAPAYGGINTVGNFATNLQAVNGQI
ncbi:MAG: alpha-amylase family glycosyl hydrolase [Terracidiphilus sp.]